MAGTPTPEVRVDLLTAADEAELLESATGNRVFFARAVGRVNIGEIEDGVGSLGYRIARDSSGRGYARAAVGNVASQRVLEANGFEQLPEGAPAEVEHGGRREQAVHFVRSLGP